MSTNLLTIQLEEEDLVATCWSWGSGYTSPKIVTRAFASPLHPGICHFPQNQLVNWVFTTNVSSPPSTNRLSISIPGGGQPEIKMSEILSSNSKQDNIQTPICWKCQNPNNTHKWMLDRINQIDLPESAIRRRYAKANVNGAYLNHQSASRICQKVSSVDSQWW